MVGRKGRGRIDVDVGGGTGNRRQVMGSEIGFARDDENMRD